MTDKQYCSRTRCLHYLCHVLYCSAYVQLSCGLDSTTTAV